jgi:hypothetical protein
MPSPPALLNSRGQAIPAAAIAEVRARAAAAAAAWAPR